MLKNDLIDKKIEALLDYLGIKINIDDKNKITKYEELRDFAEDHGGLLYYIDNEVYLILNFIGEKDFLLIPVEYVA